MTRPLATSYCTRQSQCPFSPLAMSPPTAFDRSSLAERNLQETRENDCIVFATVFSPDGEWLCAASNFGQICVWYLPAFFSEGFWESEITKAPLPNLSFRAHENVAIYSLTFAGMGDSCMLVSGGEESIRVWRWDTITELAKESGTPSAKYSSVSNLEPLSELVCPQKTGQRGAMPSLCETNGVTVDTQTGLLYSAGGDGCAYAWDLATASPVRCYQGAHRDYLHSLAVLPCSQQLLTGGEDGLVGVWDNRTAACVDLLDIGGAAAAAPAAAAAAAATSTKSSTTLKHTWVSCVRADAGENWMAVGGGVGGGGSSSSSSGGNGGLVQLWHLPSRTPIFSQKCRGAVNDVTVYEDELLTGGATGQVSRWSRSKGDLLSTAPTSSPSLFSVHLNSSSSSSGSCSSGGSGGERVPLLVTAGCSSVLDVFVMNGGLAHKSFSLQFR